jgi:prepilin-type processing-associated H-X9-DG protein
VSPQDAVFSGTFPAGFAAGTAGSEIVIPQNYPALATWLANCARSNTVGSSARVAHSVRLGQTWSVGLMGQGLGTMVQPPNAKYPNCSTDSSSFPNPGVFSLSSFHSGGAGVLMADGSVRFLKDSTNVNTILKLGSRGQGEVVSSNEY